MVIIYLETNSIMAIAKGRNKALADFIYQASSNIRFVIPSICLMETIVAIEREEKRQKSFSQNAQIEINEAKRSQELNNAQSFANYLKLSLINYEQMSSDFETIAEYEIVRT
jgi:predicted nucleic acid-binding protein